ERIRHLAIRVHDLAGAVDHVAQDPRLHDAVPEDETPLEAEEEIPACLARRTHADVAVGAEAVGEITTGPLLRIIRRDEHHRKGRIPEGPLCVAGPRKPEQGEGDPWDAGTHRATKVADGERRLTRRACVRRGGW